jgi:hypothetical protein
MVRDLEQVDARQASGEQLRVNGLLDVTHQQEPPTPDDALEHH